MRTTRLAGTVAALAAALCLGWGTGAATPAAAAAPRVTACPVAGGYACFWVDINRGGAMGKVAGTNHDYRNLKNSSGCTAYPGTWNDCISSVENQGTSCTVYFYSDADYHGTRHSVSIGDRVNNVGTGFHDPAFNDAISSNNWCTPK
ncbi:peptidase inhibitor family I36 protein [Streptomyces sp. NPDC020983]|uniref:peptidase inhibitor family I36 protein n=1 Tax=Streptomyces sp. NPDC020983 TaxID=3365106 RepID=UPI0037B00A4A